MTKQNANKSLNGLVFEIAYKRLKLQRREKIILQRLLGFLIRNDKPFPFSRAKLSELTGYSERSIDYAINELEKLRLISRVGFTNRTRFAKGNILRRICSLAQKRISNIQYNKCTLPQKLRELNPTTAKTAYNKTYLSSKHKEGEKFSNQKLMAYQDYFGCIKSDIKLGLLRKDTKILSIEEWQLVEQIKNL
jgi:DNA-binding transcriptional regulator GbsR (MarR family)